jgi:hypothetical protein
VYPSSDEPFETLALAYGQVSGKLVAGGDLDSDRYGQPPWTDRPQDPS